MRLFQSKNVKMTLIAALIAIIGGVLNVNAAPAKNRVGQLSAKAHSGRIAVRSDRGDLPAGASLTLTRQKDAATLERVQNALNKRKGIKSAKPAPAVLAAYDISIDEGKTAWQPTAGSPVRVTVTLDEPVAAVESTDLGIVHIADEIFRIPKWIVTYKKTTFVWLQIFRDSPNADWGTIMVKAQVLTTFISQCDMLPFV